jgi:hypothetical protein
MGRCLIDIRQRLADLIKAAGTAAGERVFVNRYTRPHADELPCVIVFSKETEHDRRHTEYRHLADITVVAVCRAQPVAGEPDTNADVAVDLLLEDLEQVLDQNPTLEGQAADCWMKRTDYEGDEQGEVALASGRLTVTVEYYEDRPKPAPPVHPPLEGVGVKWDLGPTPDGTIEAEDQVELPG